MNILGISAFFHDSAAALINDGKIISAVQEERFTRKKHDPDFPINAISFCLKKENLKNEDIDYIIFYEKPFIKFERLLDTYLSFAPFGFKSFQKAMPIWIKDKLWIKQFILTHFKGFKGKILFSSHHRSHAASAFYPSPFDKSAIITVDGVGEWSTTTIACGENNKINIIKEINFPHSLGLLYSAFTYHSGFKVNSGEYKLMGLAPYGNPKYVQFILDNIIDIKDDGSYRLNMKFFDFATGLKMTSKYFDKIFGKPRKNESQITQREMDLARSIQDVIEIVMLKIAKYAKTITGFNYLCLAGGVALNCVANGKILREKIFKDIWVQPASGDAGGALGAALSVWYEYLDNKRNIVKNTDNQEGSYLGTEYSNEHIRKFLTDHNIPFIETTDDTLFNKVAELLKGGFVIGWFQGKMEFGPRALGNRSIIADARSSIMQKKLNLKIKFRESFRPFAPAVLNSKVSEFFEIDKTSPYMLFVCDVKKKHQFKMSDKHNKLFGIEKLNIARSIIPAVTHVDYSARLQTVHEDTNPKFYKLIQAFNNITGCPVIINTSFNVRGEPIVESPIDAYKCFMRTEMDYLVLGNFIINKNNQPQFNDDINWKEKFTLD